MKLIITNPAENDLLNIINFIEQDNKLAAENVFLAFKKTFNTLKDTPYLGRKRPDLTEKEVLFLCVKKNYLVIYEIIDSTVIISRILTRYQDICSLL